MSRVLILTTAVNYTPEQMYPLWNSLKNTGFTGSLVMLVDEKTADLLELYAPSFVQLLVYEDQTPQKLLQAAPKAIQDIALHEPQLDSESFLLAVQKINPIWTTHFYSSFNHPSVFRYLFYHDYLKEHAKNFDACISCDARDVVFQVNPDQILSTATPLTFGLEPATTTLGSEAFNTAWVQYLYGQDIFEIYKGRRISCSGATVANNVAMQNYIAVMADHLLRRASLTRRGYGFDQAVHNRLWWDNALPQIHTSENFFADVVNLFGEAENNVTKHIRDGLVYREDTNQPVMLVHQYDRYPSIEFKATQKDS